MSLCLDARGLVLATASEGLCHKNPIVTIIVVICPLSFYGAGAVNIYSAGRMILPCPLVVCNGVSRRACVEGFSTHPHISIIQPVEYAQVDQLCASQSDRDPRRGVVKPSLWGGVESSCYLTTPPPQNCPNGRLGPLGCGKLQAQAQTGGCPLAQMG